MVLLGYVCLMYVLSKVLALIIITPIVLYYFIFSKSSIHGVVAYSGLLTSHQLVFNQYPNCRPLTFEITS